MLQADSPLGRVPMVGKDYDVAAYRSFSDSSQRRIHAFFQKHHRSGIFNGTYLMFSHDSLIKGHLGYANFATRDTLINDDLFQLASVSKTVTGISVMLLHQDGFLNIEDSVHWYLPELRRHNLTIKNLLSHASGLPDYFYFSGSNWPMGARHMRNDDVIPQLNAQNWRAFSQPGRSYNYCNTNYALLANIVERVSGMEFRAFVKKRIFDPAGMKYSHIANFDSVPLSKYDVQGYENRSLYADNAYNGTTGDKGVYSNGMEMFLLDRALRGSYILHQGSKEMAYSTQVATSNDGQYYGLGWRIKWIDGRKWVYHNGWWKGFRTYFWRCLDDDKVFVVLSNNVYGAFLKTSDMVELLKF